MRSVLDHFKAFLAPARTKLRPAVLALSLGTVLLVAGCGGKEQATAAAPTVARAAAAETGSAHAHAEAAVADDHTAHADADHADTTHADDVHDEAAHSDAAHVHDASLTTIPARPLDELAGDSLYHLKSAWTDQHQRAVTLPELAGGPTVVVMFYGDCTTACPLLVKSAEEIEAALPEPLRDTTNFVMVSFDTEHDTPGRLLDYAASKGLDRDGWHWLVGTPLQTRQLATMLGVQYRDAGNGVWAHSNVVSVLDAGGVPVARLEGLGVDLGPAVAAITAAAGG